MPRIKDLTTKSGNLSNADYFATDNGTLVTKIDYTALAKAIIEQYNGSTLAGSAQSVQAALNSLNSNSVTSLGTAITDPNTATAVGAYRIADMSAASNVPTDVTWTSAYTAQLLCYYRSTTTRIFQTLYVYVPSPGAVRIYNRVQSGATSFSAWERVPTGSEMDAATAATTVTQLRNTDLNTLTEPMRIYYAGGSHGCTNVPANAASFGLIVLQISSGYRAQICISSGLNVYIRRYASDSWGSWFEFAKSAIS